MMRRFSLAFLVSAILIMMIAGCGKTMPSATPEPTKITLSTEAPKPPTPQWTATLQPAAAATEETIQPADQSALKDKWRYSYTGGILLFESCRMMFETHLNYKKGEIPLNAAQTQLRNQSDVISLVNVQITNNLPDEDTGPYVFDLETDMRSLIELWDRMNSSELGTPEITNPLSSICSSLDRTLSAIMAAAREEGITQKSLGEIESEEAVEDILNKLYQDL